jgi:small subunit ribosomal protein S9
MAEQDTTTATADTGTTTASAPAEPTGPKTFVWGVGRRKSAVARVRIAPGTGKITVNERELNDYFTFERDRKAIFGPLEVTNTGGKMDVFVTADGGGPTGQAGAIVMGLGRALAKFDPGLEGSLRNAGFLTRDSRMKERKKYGQRGARRRFQFSKR